VISISLFAITSYLKMRYWSCDVSFLFNPSVHAPVSGRAQYYNNSGCSVLSMYGANRMLIAQKSFACRSFLDIHSVVQLNGIPWINSIRVDDMFPPIRGSTIRIYVSPIQYNKLDNIYYHLINHAELDTVISNVRSIL
jgi:hypothetical protein